MRDQLWKLRISDSLPFRLNLPGNILHDEHTETKYDADTGKFFFRFRKETPGEHFEDLSLLTKLLAPKMKPGQKPIEEIGDSE